MMTWRLVVLLTATLALSSAQKVRYDDYRVYRVTPTSPRQLQLLTELGGKYNEISFWKSARGVNIPADVMVPPKMQEVFLEILESSGMKTSVYINNVQKLIDNERPANTPKTQFGWDNYYNLVEIYDWLDTLPEAYPGIVTTVVGGSTYEGREIRGVKISYGTGNPAFVIEGGIHACEWITTAGMTWFINEILTTNDSDVRSVVGQYDVYVFPTTNPDGYEYTWTTDRLWVKNRRPYSPCVGANINRNFGFHWAEYDATSEDTCAEKYAGPEPFSEVESRSFAAFLDGLGDDLLVYVNLHAYAQLILYPYGVPGLLADNDAELMEIVTRAADALAVRYGTNYTVGSVQNALYPATGTSIDWLAGERGKRYALVWELRDRGEFGYLLPVEQIVPTSQETFDSVVSALRDVLANTAGRGGAQ